MLLWLNSDARPTEGAIARCLEALEARPEAAIAGPRLRFPDGRLQRSAHRFPSVVGELPPARPADGFDPATLLGQNGQPKVKPVEGTTCGPLATKLPFEFEHHFGKRRRGALADLKNTPLLNKGSTPQQAVYLQDHAGFRPLNAGCNHGRLTDHPVRPSAQFQQLVGPSHGEVRRQGALAMRPFGHAFRASWPPSSLRTRRDHP